MKSGITEPTHTLSWPNQSNWLHDKTDFDWKNPKHQSRQSITEYVQVCVCINGTLSLIYTHTHRKMVDFDKY